MIIRFFYIGILFLVSLYFLVGGISNVLIDEQFEHAREQPYQPVQDLDSKVFRNIDEMKTYEEYEKMLTAYPLYEKFGEILMYLINLMCFGMMGSIVRILLTWKMGGLKNLDSKDFLSPILGALIGLIIIGVSAILPDFKYASGTQKVYYALALLGGIYSVEFFNWLKYKAEQILKTK